VTASDNEVTVMFADIVGSTRLYEILGDQIAEELVTKTLKQLSAIVVKNDGEAIKTVGDEVMCRFSQVDQAISAATEMHVFLAEKTAPSREYKLAIRVGAHHGSTIENDGDLYGDAVNIASRVAALARGGKTMITKYAYEQLPDPIKGRCRHFICTTVKGKELPIDVFDVVWEQTDELTSVASNAASTAMRSILTIQFNDSVIKMSANTITSVTVGRGQDCDLIVPSPQASREHCKIECNRGKFVFNDNSANGSYVNHDQTELFFHQERVPLLGEGLISLGEPSEKNHDFRLHYSIEQL
jgi:adenylate cyclase